MVVAVRQHRQVSPTRCNQTRSYHSNAPDTAQNRTLTLYTEKKTKTWRASAPFRQLNVLPVNFGTVYLLTSGLPRHSQHFFKS